MLLKATAVNAQFTFTTNNNGITITGYTGTNTSVFIPNATNGYTNLQRQAGAIAQMASGFIYGAVITNSGAGYTIAPSLRFLGGGGFGAAGNAMVSNGMVAAITVKNAGSGYTSLPAVQIDPPSGLLPDATNSTVNITSVNTNNSGNYFVVVSNGGGSVTSSVASLTIAYPPAISQSPQSVNAAQGKNAAFNISASGTPTPNYQWFMVSGIQSNAAAVPVVINGFVLGANMTNVGAGYLAVPKVQILGGSGNGPRFFDDAERFVYRCAKSHCHEIFQWRSFCSLAIPHGF